MVRKRRARTLDNILTGKEVKTSLDALETDREQLSVKGPLYAGFRSSEFIHMTEDWIYGGKIHIPSEIPCDCWECKKVRYQIVKKKRSTADVEKRLEALRQKFSNSLSPEQFEELKKELDTFSVLLASSKKSVKKIKKPPGVWMPKSKKGARAIPLNELSAKLFDWYFKDHHAVREMLPCTRSHYYTVNQIEKRIKDQLIHELFPHVLRGVYASRLAASRMPDGSRISPFTLCHIMGWEDIKTAMKYIAIFGSVPQAENLNMKSFIS